MIMQFSRLQIIEFIWKSHTLKEDFTFQHNQDVIFLL